MDKKRLAYAITKFLRTEINSNTQEDESLEVAIQCLENAFGISADDSSLDVGVCLDSVFEAVLKTIESEKPALTPEIKAEAEKFRGMGNERLREEKFQDAVECYTKAINLDSNNPFYFCNRAAAHYNLGDYPAAIEDSQKAIAINPSYSKAYGRLGLALTSLKKHKEAKEAYLKALQLEPENETYKRNLSLNEEYEKTAAAVSPENPAMNMDNLTSMLGNQRLMAMASQMLSDPSMQSMLNNLISGNQAPGAGGMDGLLQAGQRLAQVIQSTNPNLVEQLRQQMTRNGGEQPPQPPAP